MSEKCPSCSGTGYITVDCPYCRQSEAPEYSQAPRTCLGCHDHGYLDDVCPTCGGSGMRSQEAV